MAEIYKFFNSSPTDERWYEASDFADYFGDVLSTGLLNDESTDNLLVTTDGGSMVSFVKTGKALMQGYQYKNTSNKYLTHNMTPYGFDRIDRVVLRLDKTADSRFIKVFIVEGEPVPTGGIATPPELTRDDYIYELSLAQVKITSNISSITANDIIDERAYDKLCGFATSLISVPITVFQQQFDEWFKANTGIMLNHFSIWFESVRDILDENVAGNLYNLIETNTQNITDSIKQRKNVVLSELNWIYDDEDDLYKYQLNDASITADSIVDINIHRTDLFLARDFMSACDSYDGYVMIYSTNSVNNDVTIDYRITKDVI